MKNTLSLLLLVSLCATAPAQNCAGMLRKIEAAYQQDLLDEALNQLHALRTCDTSQAMMEEAGRWTDSIFQRIKVQKQIAETQARANLDQVNRFIRQFQFNGGQTAWAYRDGLFAVINRNGVLLTDFKYENPGPFRDGVAIVRTDNRYVLVDEKGKELTQGHDYLIPATENRYLAGRGFDQQQVLDRSGNFLFQSFSEPVNTGGFKPIFEGSLQGLADTGGRVIIPPIYTYIGDFVEGMAPVEKEGKWDFIDENGQKLVLRYWHMFSDYSEEINRVAEESGKCGLIDRNGQLVLPVEYEFGPDYAYFTQIKKNEKWGFINGYGRVVVLPQYEAVKDFSAAGFTAVRKDGKWGIIDTSGQVVVPVEYDSVGDYYLFPATVLKADKWLRVDRSGRVVEESGLAGAGRSNPSETGQAGNQSLPDTAGASQMPMYPEYKDTLNASEGLIKIEQDGKWGFADAGGRLVIKPQFEWIGDRSEGLWMVIKGGKTGFVDKNGQFAVPPRYAHAWNFEHGMAQVATSEGYGFVDKTGREILPCLYRLYLCGYRIWLIGQNDRLGLFAPDHGIYIKPAYEQIGYVTEENGWIRVQKNGRWGWVDKTGQVKIPFRFDAAAPFKHGKARVLQLPYTETFYINMKGEMLLGD